MDRSEEAAGGMERVGLGCRTSVTVWDNVYSGFLCIAHISIPYKNEKLVFII
jgi:hypothetical protein